MDKTTEDLFNELSDLHTLALEYGATDTQFMDAMEMLHRILYETPNYANDRQDAA